MTQLVLQPSAATASKMHFRHTIATPVDLASVQGLLGDERDGLVRLANGECLRLWGVTAGNSQRQWEKVQVGDRVLFVAHKEGFLTAPVALVFHNRPLAEHLWGLDRQGRSWEYMYALGEVRYVSIPIREVNRALGYASTNNVQGFTVCDEDKSARTLEIIADAPDAGRPEWVSDDGISAHSGSPTSTQLAQASKAWRVLTEVACGGGTITYTDLGARINMGPRSVRFPLSAIQRHCLEGGLPPLTVLAVSATTGLPGSGSIVDPSDAVTRQQAGLTEMIGTREWWIVPLNRENGCGSANRSCYYVDL